MRGVYVSLQITLTDGVMIGRSISGALMLIAGLAACGTSPVEWEEQSTVPAERAPADSRLALDTAGHASFVGARAVQPSPPDAAGACPGSLRFARLDDGQVYAVWWRPRADSTAALVASYSRDAGLAWAPTVPVDSLDIGRIGCHRPPPSIAAGGEYVHVSYALSAPEGTGVFFSHSMDRAGLFHEPVPIVYGDRLTESSVVSEGDRVVVAYVDPNTKPASIGLAISATMGHIFETRTPASAGIGVASAPDVALRGDHIAISWLERAPRDSLGGTRMVRSGRLR